MVRTTAIVLFSCVIWCGAMAQDAAPGKGSDGVAESGVAPHFDVVDVHESPYRNSIFMQRGHLVGERYVLHQAKMPQLISAAYDYDSSLVVGGPIWLDLDRFDVIGKAPAATTPATLKLMMRAMLADRFSLVVHEGLAPLPTYLLKANGDKPNMKESESSRKASCDPQPHPNATPDVPMIDFKCTNESMKDFAKFLQNIQGGGYIDLSTPVVDMTGTGAAYDFEIHWTPQQAMAPAGVDAVTLSDALESQLGLKIVLEKVPRPALIVDSVNETPTPNPPGTDQALPKIPDAQFEMATIKPSKPDERVARTIRGDLFDAKSITLKGLIGIAWDVNTVNAEGLIGAPAWLDRDKFDIFAKVASKDPTGAPIKPDQLDIEVIRQMLQEFLAERFQMKYHTEMRPVTAYTLVAAAPKLKSAADPTARMKCTEGPGPDGRDPRKVNPRLNRLLWCQNMTMDAFAMEIRHQVNDYIFYPVVNATGLKGSYDFALSFASVDNLLPKGGRQDGGPNGAPPSERAVQASEPNGGASLFDALESQLGLRLEKTKREEPVIVIDHIEERPEGN